VLRLPVALRSRNESCKREQATARLAAIPSTQRILVVDDNEDLAESVAVLLRTMGNEVHTAHDGLEAVGVAAALQPDVVLMDIGLPKLSGFEAASRIREQPGGSDMVLIALTGWGQEEDRRRSKEAGFDHHLTKPIDFTVLQELLAANKLSHPERRSAKQGN
jgi:CheY-like chemotaxis protein